MSDLKGKTILLTGATAGIGRVTAEQLASRGGKLLLACRTLERAQPVLQAIRASGGAAEFLPLDLADLDSVRACAHRVSNSSEPLDILINNAGVAGVKGVTRQGFEVAFGVNHLGHFALTQQLLPKLLEQPRSRIVIVASDAHYQARGVSFEHLREPTRSWLGVSEYRVSKLANVLYAKELARRYSEHGLEVCALHPGVVASELWRHVPQPFRWVLKLGMISNEEGAETSVHCATTRALENGAYYSESKVQRPSPAALDDQLAAELFERSREWTK